MRFRCKELEPTGGFVVIHAHKRYFGTPINGRTARAERNFTVFNGDGSCAGGAFAADNSTHIFRNIICAAKLKANTCRFSDGQLDIYKGKSEFTLLRTSRFSFGTPSAVIGMPLASIGMPLENACSSFERRLSAALPVWVLAKSAVKLAAVDAAAGSAAPSAIAAKEARRSTMK